MDISRSANLEALSLRSQATLTLVYPLCEIPEGVVHYIGDRVSISGRVLI